MRLWLKAEIRRMKEVRGDVAGSWRPVRKEERWMRWENPVAAADQVI